MQMEIATVKTAPSASNGNTDLVSNGGSLCYTVATELATFCPSSEILGEVQFKSNNKCIWREKIHDSTVFKLRLLVRFTLKTKRKKKRPAEESQGCPAPNNLLGEHIFLHLAAEVL